MELTNLLVTGTLIFIVLVVSFLLVRFRNFVPQVIEAVIDAAPAEVREAINAAVEFATVAVENMDLHGAFEDMLDKSEEKLATAVDLAVQYIEQQFAMRGFEIDIDEELIKTYIQNHVWQNPNLFPSRTKRDES